MTRIKKIFGENRGFAMDAALEQKVRERAYDMWMAAGMHSGSADLHWLSAEQAVKTEFKTSDSATVAKPAKAAKVATTAKSAKPAAAKPAAAKPAATKATAPRKTAKPAMSASI